MNETAQDMRKWTLIDTQVTNKGSSLYEETTKIWQAPARLTTRTTRRGNRYQQATISWQTSDEKFPVKTAEEITCEDGERIVNVRITTVTSSHRGCNDGNPRLIEVEVEPGTWRTNLLFRPY